jgi:putative protein kinase ArgK-like GTPase of G3E family
VAAREEGAAALADAIAGHRAHLERSGGLAESERRRARRPFLERVRERVAERFFDGLDARPEVAGLLRAVERRELDPCTAADLWVDGDSTGGSPG